MPPQSLRRTAPRDRVMLRFIHHERTLLECWCRKNRSQTKEPTRDLLMRRLQNRWSRQGAEMRDRITAHAMKGTIE